MVNKTVINLLRSANELRLSDPNQWAHQKDQLIGADLRDADLEMIELQGLCLQNTCLENATLAGAVLSRIDLRNANLRFSNLRGIYVEGGSLENADLSHADFRKLRAEKSKHRLPFDDKRRFGSNWIRSVLDGVDLRRAILKGVKCDHGVLSRSNFDGADLSGASFVETELVSTNLSSVNLANAILRGAQFAEADLSGAALQGADFTDANLQRALVFDADFTGAKGLSPDQFVQSIGWETAQRDAKLACGHKIPPPRRPPSQDPQSRDRIELEELRQQILKTLNEIQLSLTTIYDNGDLSGHLRIGGNRPPPHIDLIEGFSGVVSHTTEELEQEAPNAQRLFILRNRFSEYTEKFSSTFAEKSGEVAAYAFWGTVATLAAKALGLLDLFLNMFAS